MLARLTSTNLPCHWAAMNKLWKLLPAATRERLEPHLTVERVDVGQVLIDSGAEISTAYFPATAVASLVCITSNGASAEVDLVGKDGMVGMDRLFGSPISASQALITREGTLVAVPSSALLEQVDSSPETRRVLLRYAHTSYARMAQAAVCSRHHSVEQRLCRWLLLYLDRTRSNDVRVSQDMIAQLLGVRRESVTEAAGRMRRDGIIDSARGRTTVLEADGLRRHACECYYPANQGPAVVPLRQPALKTYRGSPLGTTSVAFAT